MSGFDFRQAQPRSPFQPRQPKGKLADVSVDVSLRASATRFFNIGDGRRLRFLSLYQGPDRFDHQKHGELKERNRIEIVFPKNVSIKQALDEIRIWQTFISFGLQIPTFLDDLAILKDVGKRLQRMSLFVPERKWEVPKRQHYRDVVLFNQSELGKRMGARLKRWRECQGMIDMAVLLYRGARYLNDVYISHQHTHLFAGARSDIAEKSGAV
jgi:hypothetical protein